MYGFQSPPDFTALTRCAGCHQVIRGRAGGWHFEGRIWHTRCRNWQQVETPPYGHLEQPLRKLWRRAQPGQARDAVSAFGRWLTHARRTWPQGAADWLSELNPRLDELRSQLRLDGIDQPGF